MWTAAAAFGVRLWSAPGGGTVAERDCYLRDFNFLGFVVLITAVETVDNPILPRRSAVKPCSLIVR